MYSKTHRFSVYTSTRFDKTCCITAATIETEEHFRHPPKFGFVVNPSSSLNDWRPQTCFLSLWFCQHVI